MKAVGLLLVGVLGQSAVSAPSSDTATIHMKKSYDVGAGIGTGTRQLFFKTDGMTCRGKKKIAAFSGITKSERSVPVPARKRLTLWGFTEHFRIGERTVCQNATSFTPEPGATYDVELKTWVSSGCILRVVDRTTQQAPSDITYHNDLICKD